MAPINFTFGRTIEDTDMNRSKRLTAEQIVEIERLTKAERVREQHVSDEGQSQLYQYLSEVVLKSPLTV
ncbi:MAG: hypothetical protein ACREBU_14675 [Nitrososphaera sp.]